MNEPDPSFEATLLASLRREMQQPADAVVMKHVAERLGAALGAGASMATASQASAASVEPVASVASAASAGGTAVNLVAASHTALAPLLVLLGSAALTTVALVGVSALSTPKPTPFPVPPARTVAAPRRANPAPATSESSSTKAFEGETLLEPSRVPSRAASPQTALATPPAGEFVQRLEGGLMRPEDSAKGPVELSLRAQQALLDTARHALAQGESAAALEALAQHAARFPQSVLEEEREALTVKALRAAQRNAEANEHAARFSARYPSSVFLPSVSAASIP